MGGALVGCFARACEALALDLCAHALRGVTIGVAGLAWHGLGFDPGCDRKKALKALDDLRTKGPMTLSDLTRHGKVKKPLRGPLLELFVAENLVRVEGKMVVATSYEEFAAALYARNEYPEPAKHWTRAAGMAGATA